MWTKLYAQALWVKFLPPPSQKEKQKKNKQQNKQTPQQTNKQTKTFVTQLIKMGQLGQMFKIDFFAIS